MPAWEPATDESEDGMGVAAYAVGATLVLVGAALGAIVVAIGWVRS